MAENRNLASRLEEQRQADWVKVHASKLKKFPRADAWLRVEVYDDEDEPPAAVQRDARAFRISALSDAQRQTLFETLFPKIAHLFERAWQDLATAPYGASPAYPTAFRAPGSKVIVDRMRDAWTARAIRTLAGHDPDPIWLATWGCHLDYGLSFASRLLSAALNIGGPLGDEIFDILKQSASNQHDIGMMGNHVIDAMLDCNRPDAWEFIGKMLVAAQRQEGLRQYILEQAHSSHPGAFRHLLNVVVDENLVRFSATVRAIDVWFGFNWDSMSTAYAASIVERVTALLDNRKARLSAINGGDAETAYLALWCEGHADAIAASELAKGLLESKSPEKRWVGLEALGTFALPDSLNAITRALDDDDLRVAARAMDALSELGSLDDDDDDSEDSDESETDEALDHSESRDRSPAVFDKLVAILGRIKGKEEKFKPLVFPWGRARITAAEVGTALVCKCPLDRGDALISHLHRFDAGARVQATCLLAGRECEYADGQPVAPRRPLSELATHTLISLLGDPAKDVREAAAYWLEKSPPTQREIARHEELLSRTASDVRTRAISRILALDDQHALATVGRLLSMGTPNALAGLETLHAMGEHGRSLPAAKAMALDFRNRQKKLTKDLSEAVDSILALRSNLVASPSDAFGLARAFAPRPIPTIRAFPADDPTPASVACIWSLNDLVEANKTLELKEFDERVANTTESDERPLLGGLRNTWHLQPKMEVSREKDRARCPFPGLLHEWMRSRPASTRDKDGLELVRAWMLMQKVDQNWRGTRTIWPEPVRSLAPEGSQGDPPHHAAIDLLIDWALRLGESDAVDFFLNQVEGAIERGDVVRGEDSPFSFSRGSGKPGHSSRGWIKLYRACPANWARRNDIEPVRRLDGLLRASSAMLASAKVSTKKNRDEGDNDPDDDFRSSNVRLDEFISLWDAGDVTDDELLLRVTRPPHRPSSGDTIYELNRLTSLHLPSDRDEERTIKPSPRLDALVEKLRQRVLEIELARGDADTAATPHAFSLGLSGGIDAAIPALAGLGKLKLVRGYIHKCEGKAACFSTLVSNSRPRSADTPAAFASAAKAAGLSDERLVDLALYQPFWAAHVEHALHWPGLEESVLWLRTHTREAKYLQNLPKAAWEAKAAELTPISPESLADGAVDRAWFQRCYHKLGPKRWAVLHDSAKYASSGSGHTRAQLFADAILGKVTEKELVQRIKTKRHQDAARALGLLALKPGDAGHKQVLARYKVLQEMRRTSRKHGGSMLRAAEQRAVEIAMENLSWTAGFADPLRLQWAMEIEELGDLAKGPVVVEVADTTVTLEIDEHANPTLSATKAGKQLQAIPPKVKKDKRVVELADRLADLRRQGSRVRNALESAMCRGDTFAGDELATLFSHPLLKSALSRLVLVGATKSGGTLIGYPDKNGKALRRHDASLEPLKASDSLRIAHPLDLLATKHWHEWQSECFKAERVQPFKQIFREIYTPIESELAKGDAIASNLSRRYAGQQVQPRKSLALFGARGWVARPEEGVQRTFHHERITVHVEFEEGFYTPAEIDGLTLAGVSFSKAGKHEDIPIRDVPPRVFSEVMRDLDLVVSVAHRGEVDPEASHSTVEMRAALLKETCSLLSLTNVRVEASRAIIKGELGEYALHLASGTIHKLPGGTIWVIPVHSQHRGRIFLPFADDDPKTAEIISKVLLLARDREIQDPAILAQIRSS